MSNQDNQDIINEYFWTVYSRVTGQATYICRAVLLSVFAYYIFNTGGDPQLLPALKIYITLELAQYMSSAISYKYMSRYWEQHLDEEPVRWPWVNYGSTLFHWAKIYCTLYIVWIVL